MLQHSTLLHRRTSLQPQRPRCTYLVLSVPVPGPRLQTRFFVESFILEAASLSLSGERHRNVVNAARAPAVPIRPVGSYRHIFFSAAAITVDGMPLTSMLLSVAKPSVCGFGGAACATPDQTRPTDAITATGPSRYRSSEPIVSSWYLRLLSRRCASELKRRRD